MKNSGYVFTVSTFFLFSTVLILSLFYSSQVEEMDISGPKLAALYDDVRGDLFEILNISVKTYSTNNFTVLVFNEMLPTSDIRDKLTAFESFVESDAYTSNVQDDIEDRAGSMTGADISMSLANPSLFIKPYSYIYDHDTLAKRDILIHPQNNNTNLLGIMINLSLDENLTVDADLVGGSLPIRLVVAFKNGTYEFEDNVSRTETSRWTFLLPNGTGSINITAGRALAERDWKNSTISIKLDRVDLQSEIQLVFRKSYNLILESGFTITLRDILGYRKAKLERGPFTDVVDYTRIKDNVWFEIKEIEGAELPLYVPPPGEEAGPGDVEPPITPPQLLGYCYCAAPCYYWEEYWEGETPCTLRPCPDWCEPGTTMLTYLL